MSEKGAIRMTETLMRDGVTFENHPIYKDEDSPERFYSQKHLEMTEKIAISIDQKIRPAVTVDCNKIPEYVEEEPIEPPTEAEKRIMHWLDSLNQD